MKKSTKVAVASAMAALLAGGATFAADKAEKSESKSVKCDGSNSCKGKSACSTAKNACKGMNACKGQGWVTEKNEKACTSKGGTVAKEGSDR